jgi:hypothetical protein
MKVILIFAVALLPTLSEARTECHTRQSGCYTKTSCSTTYRGRTTFSHGTKYKSGSVTQSYWR